MKFSLALAAAMAAYTSAQSISTLVGMIPTCADACLEQYVTQVCGSLTDYACQCGANKATLTTDLTPCILSSCSTANALSVESISSEICSVYSASGGGSSSAASAATSSAAAATSSAAAAATSASMAASSQAASISSVVASAASSVRAAASSGASSAAAAATSGATSAAAAATSAAKSASTSVATAFTGAAGPMATAGPVGAMLAAAAVVFAL